MHALLKPDSTDVSELLQRYDVGELVDLQPMAGSDDRYLLSVRRNGRESQLVLALTAPTGGPSSAYVALLDACSDAGLPVAVPIRNQQGVPYEALNNNVVLLTRRLAGRHVQNPTVGQVEAIGRFLARLHAFCSSPDVPLAPHRRDHEWLRACVDGLNGQAPYETRDLLNDAVAQTASLLQRTDVQQLPTGAIHANLLRDNVLFNEHGITGVVGFRHACNGYLLYDLAVAANDWCSDVNGVQDPERTFALLRAYQHLRPLARQELWFLPSFCVYAALVSWLERLAHADSEEQIWFHNPDELRRVVEQHTAHCYYLDERLLR